MDRHPAKYRFLAHPSDIKIAAYGHDLPETFINAARGMMAYIYGKNQTTIEQTEQIEITAENLESLLVNWLAKILTLSAINHHIYIDFSIQKFNTNKIIATIRSGKAKADNEIKAVTYHELELKSTKDGWSTTVVYDI